jgi:8-oxo-dGTP pyrophosphatase MutT (NUDIX family)
MSDTVTNYAMPCAGFVVFSQDMSKTILVQTPRGRLSFPKGKRKKKKNETDMQTALRELEEETGLVADDIDIISPTIYIDEMTKKGKPSVRYFIAIIKSDWKEFVFDKMELVEVRWYECDEIPGLSDIKDGRKEVLIKAISIIKS